MKIDYYVCSNCKKVYKISESIVCDCCEMWCSKECAEKDGLILDYNRPDIVSTCNFCSK